MARRIRVTTWYAREAGRTLRSGSPRAVVVARTVRTLAEADELPGPSDFEAMVRPIGRAWVRRAAGRNLWLWFRIREDEFTFCCPIVSSKNDSILAPAAASMVCAMDSNTKPQANAYTDLRSDHRSDVRLRGDDIVVVLLGLAAGVATGVE